MLFIRNGHIGSRHKHQDEGEERTRTPLKSKSAKKKSLLG